jgi:uncharacterized membrane protein YfcA
MEIFRYILYFMLLLVVNPAHAAADSLETSAFGTDSVGIVERVLHAQGLLLLIFLMIGAAFGILWRRRTRVEDFGWIIVVLILAVGFACVFVRVKLGL